MSTIIVRLKLFLYRLGNYFYYLIKSKGNLIVLNACIDLAYGKIKRRNFGDELSYYILCELTGKTIANYSAIFHRIKCNDILFIGSLVEYFTTPNSIVWGSGAICGDIPLKNKPRRVCAVRGRYTRQYLLSHGVDCPEVYGDPALLLPLVYEPKVEKKYKIGLIPHYVDKNNPLFLRLLELDTHIKLISFSDYDEDWHSVIDLINECECIISSSLHGLIIADAYKIPNLWVKVSDDIIGGNFKYHDYFSGVGRTIEEPIVLCDNTDLNELLMKLKQYIPIQYNSQALIAACPVALKPIFMSKQN